MKDKELISVHPPPKPWLVSLEESSKERKKNKYKNKTLDMKPLSSFSNVNCSGKRFLQHGDAGNFAVRSGWERSEDVLAPCKTSSFGFKENVVKLQSVFKLKLPIQRSQELRFGGSARSDVRNESQQPRCLRIEIFDLIFKEIFSCQYFL